MSIFIQKVLFPTLLFTAIFLIILHSINNSKTKNSNYTLKAYKNTVALYNGEEIISIYDNIILNTLPQKDIQNFHTGINFTSSIQAEQYLDDFE